MYSQGEFLCVRCARQGKTCCQRSEIYVTPGDVQRIFRHTGLSGFYEYKPPADPSYADQSDDPVWAEHVFDSGGRRRVLKRLASGDCMFLSQTGCILPLDIRPLVCRLYPYTYTASGIDRELEHGCPSNLLADGQCLTDALCMSEDQAWEWHHTLYKEVLSDGNDNRAVL
ncbi:MAG: YkgJ family cysteine cluster protein [Desulfococcaceae bacterium]